MTITRYMPPPIDNDLLLAMLRTMFPSHSKNPLTNEQLQNLVYAYSVWWVLMLTFPTRRIVVTPPIWFVRKLHATEFERFFKDCFNYLGRIPTKTSIWGGELDFRGTQDTSRSIHELYDDAGYAWEPILITAKKQRANIVTAIN